MICPESTLGCGDCESLAQKSAIQPLWDAYIPGIGLLRLCMGLAIQGRFQAPSATRLILADQCFLKSKAPLAGTVPLELTIPVTFLVWR
jgi:hypothetical protein